MYIEVKSVILTSLGSLKLVNKSLIAVGNFEAPSPFGIILAISLNILKSPSLTASGNSFLAASIITELSGITFDNSVNTFGTPNLLHSLTIELHIPLIPSLSLILNKVGSPVTLEINLPNPLISLISAL